MKRIIFLLFFYNLFVISSDALLSNPCAAYNTDTQTICLTMDQLITLLNRHITINNTTNASTTVLTNIQQQFSISIQTFIQKTNRHADNLIAYLSEYIIKNRYHVAAYTIIAIYSFTFYYHIRMHYFLHNQSSWHNWKKEYSTIELTTMSMNNLSQSLFYTIQSQYINNQNPTDHISPLAKFIMAIDSEIKTVDKYILISTWLKRFKLSLLLPRHAALHELAQEKLRRLYFIKHIFTESVAYLNTASVT